MRKTYLDKLREEVQQLCMCHRIHPLNRHPSHLLIWKPVIKTNHQPDITPLPVRQLLVDGLTKRAGVPDCPGVRDTPIASAGRRSQEDRTTASRGR